jgi:hypothetical protein
METILGEIEHALKVRLYFLAITIALAVPDICAALQSRDGNATGVRYQEWFDANLSHKYPLLTAADCWKLRCGIVHQGRMGRKDMQYGRVIFILAAPGIHNNVINDALQLSAETFCRDVIAATRQWFAANQNDVNVKANLPFLVPLRPNGFPPYIGGAPVIG